MDDRVSLWPGPRNCGRDNMTIRMNECCLDIFSNFNSSSRFYMRNVECLDCDFTFKKPLIGANETTSFLLDAGTNLELYIENGGKNYCSEIYSFGNTGRYFWNISQNYCDMDIKDAPEPAWLNLGIVFSILAGLFLTYRLYLCALSSRFLSSVAGHVSFQELEADLGNPDARDQSKSYVQAKRKRQSRIASVDVFRGITIALMIFVNYGGGGYAIFKHAPWNGLTIADVVFPWFIWIMGLSTAVSLRSKLRTSTSRKKIFFQIVKRSLLLVALGLVLNSGKIHGGESTRESATLKNLRIPGVLQRIGATYFIVASTELLFVKPQHSERYGPWSLCPDIVDSVPQWIVSIAFVVAHEFITFKLPVPGCPTGYLGCGGRHDHSKYENCTGGAAGYLDRYIFSENHLYRHPTFEKIYDVHLPYDPEGLLGTLTSVFCAFLGLQAGRIILCYENTRSRFRRWYLWAVVLGLVAGGLCNFSQNDGLIPVNKNLWSLSYVLATSSLAFSVFGCLYFLIDYRGWYYGFPFSYAGMNAITLYVGHEVLKKFFPWYWRPYTETHGELLLMNLTATILWLAIAYVLYRRNIFISL